MVWGPDTVGVVVTAVGFLLLAGSDVLASEPVEAGDAEPAEESCNARSASVWVRQGGIPPPASPQGSSAVQLTRHPAHFRRPPTRRGEERV